MLLENFYKAWCALNNDSYDIGWRANVKAYNGADKTYDLYGGSASAGKLFPAFPSFAGRGSYRNMPNLLRLSNNADKVFYGNDTDNYYPLYDGVILGDGDTDVSFSDYALAGNIITTFTAKTSASVTMSGDKMLAMGTYNITNTGASPFTIKEIGLSCSNKESSPDARILFERTVLENPLTIGIGETKTLIYRISFSGSPAS